MPSGSESAKYSIHHSIHFTLKFQDYIYFILKFQNCFTMPADGQFVLVLELKMQIEAMKNLHQEMQAIIGILEHLQDFLQMTLLPAEFEDWDWNERKKVIIFPVVKTLQDIPKKNLTIIELFMKIKKIYKELMENSAQNSEFCEIIKDLDELNRNMKIIEQLSVEASGILKKVDIPSSLLELGLEKLQELNNTGLAVTPGAMPVTLRTQVSESGVANYLQLLAVPIGQRLNLGQNLILKVCFVPAKYGGFLYNLF